MDVSNKHGWYFKCEIGNTICTGRIYAKDNAFYLCQDKKDGDKAPDRMGYKCSWSLMTKDTDASSEISDFQASKTPFKELKSKIELVSGQKCSVVFENDPTKELHNCEIIIDDDDEVFILYNNNEKLNDDDDDRVPNKGKGSYKYAHTLGYSTREEIGSTTNLHRHDIKSIRFRTVSCTSDIPKIKESGLINIGRRPTPIKSTTDISFIKTRIINI